MELHYHLFPDGSFSLSDESGFTLTDLYPSADGRPLRATRVETGADYIRYLLAEGEFLLRFFEPGDGSVSISASLIGVSKKLHTLTVADALLPADLSGIYQAAGEMCGACGFRRADEFNTYLPLTSWGMVVLARGKEYLACWVKDHTHYHSEFVCRKTPKGRLNMCADFRLEMVNPETLDLPTVTFALSDTLDSALAAASGSIGETMHARHVMPPSYHWCSWYYNYSEFTSDQLTEYLAAFPKTEPGKKLRYVQIDAGYSSALGDWLLPRSYWPNGLDAAIREIADAGYAPGIWIGPFMAGNRSKIAKEHPDWLLRDLSGKKIIGFCTDNEPRLWGYHDEEYYVLDSSHPGVMAYLRQVFRTFRSWGVKLFKTDFMMWGYRDSSQVLRYTPGKTSVEYLREVLEMIREEIGEDSFWLGCIAPFYPFIGYADAMRIGGDVGSAWFGTFNPLGMIHSVKGTYYTNNRYFQNDPDSTFFRDFHIRLNDNEIESLAIYAALSGGCVYTSDPLHKLREDRIRLMDFLYPDSVFHVPQFPCQEEKRDEIVMLQRGAENGKTLFLVFNPTEKPIFNEYDLAGMGLGDAVWISERTPLTGKAEEPRRIDGTLTLRTPAHSGRLFLISERGPAKFREDNLWKNLAE